MKDISQPIMIGKHYVGIDSAPFIVAEAGINHNGDIERALEMVNVAKSAGCDAVKFQTFKAEEFVNDASQMFTYRSQGKEVTESMLVMFKRYELPEIAWRAIKAECDNAGILFFSTPQNRSDLDFLLKIGVPVVKVGSDDFTNLPLLQSYAESGLPLILSTGMSDLAEVYHAMEVTGGLDGYPVILLVCTSQYPTPPEDVNLRKLKTLQSAFPGIITGFSDHTQGVLASSLAVAMGAKIFEKHFTLDNRLPGPDHWFSENPKGLQEWVNAIRKSYSMMGYSVVRPTENERKNKDEFQRRIVATTNIKNGDVFSKEVLGLRRISGGIGLTPNYFHLLIGKKSNKDYREGDTIEI